MKLGPEAGMCACGHVGHHPDKTTENGGRCRHCDCKSFTVRDDYSAGELRERARIAAWLEAWKVPAKVTPEAAVMIAASAIMRGEHLK